MKIAITGASGDIGGGYFKHASARNSMHVLIRHKSMLEGAGETADVKTFVTTDGTNYEVDMIKNFTNGDVVVHFAALLNAKENTLVDYLTVNSLFTGLLSLTSNTHEQAPKFLYISSEMVYKLSRDKRLAKLVKAFVLFCQKTFLDPQKHMFDLRLIAEQFINEHQDFPFSSYNLYALTKYLGEAVVLSLPRSAVVRITNAYGPGYNNLRLIPKLIVNRLTGHNIIYSKEKRDFVYNADIHALLDTVIRKEIKGTIDCKSGETIDTDELKEAIIHMTPTAYGQLQRAAGEKKTHRQRTIPLAKKSLQGILKKTTPFKNGLLKTLRYHKEMCYHEMADLRTMKEFIGRGEKLLKPLHGSSAAYLFVVNTPLGKRVRKVAVRDGVEGNGIAKVKNESRYYQYIAKHHKRLARLYPQLFDWQVEEGYSSETIEYLPGENLYEALQIGKFPVSRYEKSLANFIEKLCHSVSDTCRLTDDGDNLLDVYYLERSLDRLQPIKKLVTLTEDVIINGKTFRSPISILTELIESPKLRRFVMPQLQSFCFHGDMTLLNTVYLEDSNEIRLIDPRGYIGMWDPLYDFGKIKLTLDGFGELIFGKETMVRKTEDGYSLDLSVLPMAVRELGNDYFDILEKNSLFVQKLSVHEPYWKLRIELASATHFLADIPFRLYTDKTEWNAISCYILGTYYLNRVYTKLKRLK